MSNIIDMTQQKIIANMQIVAMASLTKWQISCQEITLIKYRENAVFKIICYDGRRFALRVHRSGYHSDDALRSELQWIAALQASDIDVPSVVPTTDGELFVRTHLGEGGETVQIDLFEWIDGAQLGTTEGGLGQDTKDIDHTYRTIGNIAARLHNHGQTWELPQGFKRHAWDANGLVGEEPLWGRFWELDALTPFQRGLILLARDIVRAELKAMTASPEHANHYGLIHADFVPENLLVDNGVVRLIDFDDAGFGWHLFEIATALYFIRNDPNFHLAYDSLIAGYREHRALPDAVLAKLPVFMMARGFTYLGWMQTRKGTDVARELTPFVTELACTMARQFVADFGQRDTVLAEIND